MIGVHLPEGLVLAAELLGGGNGVELLPAERKKEEERNPHVHIHGESNRQYLLKKQQAGGVCEE